MRAVTARPLGAPPPEAAPPDATELRRRDLALAARCIAGDRDAQRHLFQREVDRVHRILHRILGRDASIEDVAQEALVALFRSLPRYRGEAQLGTWVDRITVRTAIRALGRRRRDPAPLDEALDVAAAEPPVDQQLDRDAAARRLYAALARLDPRMQVAFVLHVIEERTAAEIATLTGTTLVATKARIWRARRELTRRAARDPLLAALLDEGGRS